MSVYRTLVRRELGAAFKSLTGYIVVAATLLLTGVGLVDLIDRINITATPRPITEIFFSQYLMFWYTLILTTPIITMRTFAAERSSGTYEALVTTPVTDWQLVLSKFVGALLFFVIAWLPFLAVLFVLRKVTHQPELMAMPSTVGAFTGLFLIGSLYTAIGCFASSITHNQIIAAVSSFCVGGGLWALTIRPGVEDAPHSFWIRFMDYISVTRHMQDFSQGFVDLRAVIFYVTMTALFLFFTHRVIETRRWF
ncbi:MAG TPA: ABC transporter permease [Candidatus Limnocylindria bacterium]|jgi:ABC-2 type transport system permease protein|nr:ABC transporter permease [Candidatus Limnocylindria bacterium]